MTQPARIASVLAAALLAGCTSMEPEGDAVQSAAAIPLLSELGLLRSQLIEHRIELSPGPNEWEAVRLAMTPERWSYVDWRGAGHDNSAIASFGLRAAGPPGSSGALLIATHNPDSRFTPDAAFFAIDLSPSNPFNPMLTYIWIGCSGDCPSSPPAYEFVFMFGAPVPATLDVGLVKIDREGRIPDGAVEGVSERPRLTVAPDARGSHAVAGTFFRSYGSNAVEYLAGAIEAETRETVPSVDPLVPRSTLRISGTAPAKDGLASVIGIVIDPAAVSEWNAAYEFSPHGAERKGFAPSLYWVPGEVAGYSVMPAILWEEREVEASSLSFHLERTASGLTHGATFIDFAFATWGHADIDPSALFGWPPFDYSLWEPTAAPAPAPAVQSAICLPAVALCLPSR
ncbi:MAG TPA: hypothetical protein VM681_10905 [Candidatus Thermoplasmatota archaeon]|nr:hypothetical protein [Candidatus Thermoplasmatota archaeon]